MARDSDPAFTLVASSRAPRAPSERDELFVLANNLARHAAVRRAGRESGRRGKNRIDAGGGRAPQFWRRVDARPDDVVEGGASPPRSSRVSPPSARRPIPRATRASGSTIRPDYDGVPTPRASPSRQRMPRRYEKPMRQNRRDRPTRSSGPRSLDAEDEAGSGNNNANGSTTGGNSNNAGNSGTSGSGQLVGLGGSAPVPKPVAGPTRPGGNGAMVRAQVAEPGGGGDRVREVRVRAGAPAAGRGPGGGGGGGG